MLAQLRRRRRGTASHQIPREVVVFRPGHDGRLRHRRMVEQPRLDLARLHPVAAYFHLIVEPAWQCNQADTPGTKEGYWTFGTRRSCI